MFDEIRDWFHARPIFLRSLWVVIAVVLVAIVVEVVHLSDVGDSTVRLSTEQTTLPSLTLPSGATDDPAGTTTLDTAVTDATDPATASVPGGTTATSSGPAGTDPVTTFSLPEATTPPPDATTAPPATVPTTTLPVPTTACIFAARAEQLSQTLAVDLAAHDAAKLNLDVVLFKQSLLALLPHTLGAARDQTNELIALVNNVLAVPIAETASALSQATSHLANPSAAFDVFKPSCKGLDPLHAVPNP